MKGEKNCPNTTALAIKEGVGKFRELNKVRELLRKYGVSSIELWTFYLVFDTPAMLSKRFFESAIRAMKSAVDELIRKNKL